MSDDELIAHLINEAKRPGRDDRERAAEEALGAPEGSISEATVYTGPGGEGMVETRCVGCGKTARMPESFVPAHLTERPVPGLCPRCRPQPQEDK